MAGFARGARRAGRCGDARGAASSGSFALRIVSRRAGACILLTLGGARLLLAQAPQPASQRSGAGRAAIVQELAAGRQAFADKQYSEAERRFCLALTTDPQSVPARMGLGDAELALHAFEAAEIDYRQVVAAEPQMWVAHKNLVIVEAALGRWEEFERERTVLRGARERGADGISARESDVIDSFTIAGKHWIVREYFVPVGRSETRYNFESFAPDGRVSKYISLESEEAAKAALAPGGQVQIGDETPSVPASDHYALNWYTGKAHGVVHVYPNVEPSYERVRTDVMRWVRASSRTGAAR